MISYYDLLTMIKEGKEPKEIVLQLNCGTRTYIPEYDGGEFLLYKLRIIDSEDEDFHYYLSDTLLESQMLDKCIEIIEEPKKIEKLKNFPDVASWGKDYGLTSALEEQAEYNEILFYKLNELIRKVNEMDNN